MNLSHHDHPLIISRVEIWVEKHNGTATQRSNLLIMFILRSYPKVGIMSNLP